MSKWDITIEAVDLTGLVPKQEDLQAHDYPLEAWVREQVFDILNRGVTSILESKMRELASTDQAPEVAAAVQAALDQELRVAREMAERFQVSFGRQADAG